LALLKGVHTIYTVMPGDTLYSIAARFGSAIQLLEQTNALFPPVTDPGLIYPGQVLVVPEAGLQQRDVVHYLIAPGDTLYAIGLRFSATPDVLVGLNPQIQNANVIYAGTTLAVPAAIYEVEAGQTLYGISRSLGIPLRELVSANRRRPGFSPDVLYPGYRLIVPLPSSANIVVLRPLPGSRIAPGQVVEGVARAFEATIQYRIIDDNGLQVTRERTITTTAGAPAFGTFSTTIQFDRQPGTGTGELWVYERSARDGSIINLVQVKVAF